MPAATVTIPIVYDVSYVNKGTSATVDAQEVTFTGVATTFAVTGALPLWKAAFDISTVDDTYAGADGSMLVRSADGQLGMITANKASLVSALLPALEQAKFSAQKAVDGALVAVDMSAQYYLRDLVYGAIAGAFAPIQIAAADAGITWTDASVADGYASVLQDASNALVSIYEQLLAAEPDRAGLKNIADATGNFPFAAGDKISFVVKVSLNPEDVTLSFASNGAPGSFNGVFSAVDGAASMVGEGSLVALQTQISNALRDMWPDAAGTGKQNWRYLKFDVTLA